MSSYVGPLINAGLSSALVQIPAYQMGYSAFQTSLVALVGSIIVTFIPGLNTFLMQNPTGFASLFSSVLYLIPPVIMQFKFGVSGVLTYMFVALIPTLIILTLAGVIFVAGVSQKKA